MNKLLLGERERLLHMEDALAKRVVGVFLCLPACWLVALWLPGVGAHPVVLCAASLPSPTVLRLHY